MTTNEPPQEEPWAMYRDDNVVVGIIPDDVTLDETFAVPFRKRYEEIVRQEGVTAHLAVVESEDAMGWEVLDQAQQAAELGANYGLTRWAIVAPKLKQYALRNRIDVPDVDVYATEDREEAMAWARGDRPAADTF